MTDRSRQDAPALDGIELAPGVRVPAAIIEFSYSGSRGPGGQNVNKRATRAELRVPLAALPISDAARTRLAGLLGRRLTDDGWIMITGDEHRSQERNRRACLDRLRALVVRAVPPPTPRRATRPTRTSVRQRAESKRRRADIKRSRRSPEE